MINDEYLIKGSGFFSKRVKWLLLICLSDFNAARFIYNIPGRISSADV